MLLIILAIVYYLLSSIGLGSLLAMWDTGFGTDSAASISFKHWVVGAFWPILLPICGMGFLVGLYRAWRNETRPKSDS